MWALAWRGENKMKFDLETLKTWIKENKKIDVIFFALLILLILQGIYLFFNSNPETIMSKLWEGNTLVFTILKTFILNGFLLVGIFIVRVYLFVIKKDK